MTASHTISQLETRAVAAITAAFPDRGPPGPAEMHSDHCEECAKTNAIFAGRLWQELAPADLTGNPPVSLMTSAAIRYYLPALMCRCLEASGLLDCLPSMVVGILSPPNGKPPERLAAVYATFDEAQVAAIVAFLEVFEAREKLERGGAVSKPLARALSYWTTRSG